MIKHIVLWKLKDHARGKSKLENASELKTVLESLNDKIEAIYKIEVGININGSDVAYDVALYSEFESLDDLEKYQKHPEHVKIVNFVSEIRQQRVVVDYVI
jgi:hypothetical protein